MISLDDLIIGNRKIYQRSDQFKFSIDAVLLAHFGRYKPKASYVDLGTGTGILPLLITALGAGHVTGLEINPLMAELAQKSVAYNRLEEVIQIVTGDYSLARVGSPLRGQKWQESSPAYMWISDKPFDGVLVNPPYYEAGTGKVSRSTDRALALHDGVTSLERVMETARRLVKFGGSLWMVYLSSRLPYALKTMEAYGFAPRRLRPVHSFAGKPAKLVLLEGRMGGKAELSLEAPLIIYKEPGIYTEEVSGWYER